MEYHHSSYEDRKGYLANAMADKANSVGVYAITGERSRLAQSILRQPQLRKVASHSEIQKLDRMKNRYEDRMKKVANSFLLGQTTKAVHWQNADIHWAASNSLHMPSYRNLTIPSSSVKAKPEKSGASGVLYRSSDYSSFGDKTFYRLMRGNTDFSKTPPIAGLSSGPRLEFARVDGHTVFNKVTHNPTKEVVDDYHDRLNNRQTLLSRGSYYR